MPKQQKRLITVQLSLPMIAGLDAVLARGEHVSRTEILREAIRRYLVEEKVWPPLSASLDVTPTKS